MTNFSVKQVNTCDLLDAHPDCQVAMPNIEGKRFYHYGGNAAFGGEVVTVKCFEDNSRVKELLATNGRDSQGNGKVLVVDGGASMRCALLGDMIAQSGVDNGWAGVIVYGCVRDVADLAGMAIGIQALGSTPQKSHRQNLGEVNVTVTFGGMTIKSGMFIYADKTGMIVSDKALIG